MAMIKCPECGEVVDGSAGVCSNCVFPLDDKSDSFNQHFQTKAIIHTSNEEQDDRQRSAAPSEQPFQNIQQDSGTTKHQTVNGGSSMKKVSKRTKTLRNCLIAGMIIFALFAAVFFFRAHNVRTVYYNSDYFATNAYVGGDAYNYIINGTYFTGYSVTATGCMICAAVFGGAAAVIGSKSKELEHEG